MLRAAQKDKIVFHLMHNCMIAGQRAKALALAGRLPPLSKGEVTEERLLHCWYIVDLLIWEGRLNEAQVEINRALAVVWPW